MILVDYKYSKTSWSIFLLAQQSYQAQVTLLTDYKTPKNVQVENGLENASSQSIVGYRNYFSPHCHCTVYSAHQ